MAIRKDHDLKELVENELLGTQRVHEVHLKVHV